MDRCSESAIINELCLIGEEIDSFFASTEGAGPAVSIMICIFLGVTVGAVILAFATDPTKKIMKKARKDHEDGR